jgi:hypothetical protein
MSSGTQESRKRAGRQSWGGEGSNSHFDAFDGEERKVRSPKESHSPKTEIAARWQPPERRSTTGQWVVSRPGSASDLARSPKLGSTPALGVLGRDFAASIFGLPRIPGFGTISRRRSFREDAENRV